MKRQAATARGFKRRVRDLEFWHVSDPRQSGKVSFTLPTMLAALLFSLVTRARSLRGVEQRTAQVSGKGPGQLGIGRRIADNTFGKVLGRLPLPPLLACLHRLVKAEQRRGNLKPTRLPLGTVAIDGKAVGTLRWHDLCRVLGLEQASATAAQARALLGTRYPQAQFCEPEQGEPYALLRVHTATLVSSAAAPCVHLRPIAGATNEIGAMPALIDELEGAYGRTRLFGRVTTDAGNTSAGVMAKVVTSGWHYLAQIKTEHGAIYDEARRQLAGRRRQRAAGTYADKQNGKTVTYYSWRYDLTEEGWLRWPHARQLFRVRREVWDPWTNKTRVGDRYDVSSQTRDGLTASGALRLSRAHWRCEEETHWTADAELQEDRKRHAWSRSHRGSLRSARYG